MTLPFTTVKHDYRVPGEERFEDGKLIKLAANAKMVVPGDIIQIDWAQGDRFGYGNWVRGALLEVDVDRDHYGSKNPLERFVATWKVRLADGWLSGAYEPVAADEPNEDGTRQMLFRPKVVYCSIPWSWELRSDDIPAWFIYVVGHECRWHHGEACEGTDRRAMFDEVRAKHASKKEDYEQRSK